jgi:hypothetical protein
MATIETGRFPRAPAFAVAGPDFAGRFQTLAHQSIVD